MELLKKIMKQEGWNQTELGEHLGITQGQVSRAVNGRIQLRPAVRKLAENLLK